MKVTTDHPSSSYKLPVILDDDGQVLDYGPGIKKIRAKLGLSTSQLSEKVGVSRRTVEGWECGRMPSAMALKILALLV